MAACESIFSIQSIDMKIRSGIDIVDIPKFAENLKSDAFIRKVFTPAEIASCEAAANSTLCYAGKFAAKEAFMKAIGQGIRQEVWFTQIEIPEKKGGIFSIQTGGKAKQILSTLRGKKIKISISHSSDLVVAMIIMECDKVA